MLPKLHPIKKTYVDLRRSKERLDLYLQDNKNTNASKAIALINQAMEYLEKEKD